MLSGGLTWSALSLHLAQITEYWKGSNLAEWPSVAEADPKATDSPKPSCWPHLQIPMVERMSSSKGWHESMSTTLFPLTFWRFILLLFVPSYLNSWIFFQLGSFPIRLNESHAFTHSLIHTLDCKTLLSILIKTACCKKITHFVLWKLSWSLAIAEI